jgi:pyruvate formate-lyase/glycerol dehydratase family glycyl radical enzyme
MSISGIAMGEIDKVNVLTKRIQNLKREGQEAKACVSSQASHSFTASWKETTGQPIDVRRAKAYVRTLKESPVVIRDGELIVGSETKYVRGMSPMASNNPANILNQLSEGHLSRRRSGTSFAEVEEEDGRALKEDALYWDSILPPPPVFLNEEFQREFGDDFFHMLFSGARIIDARDTPRGQRFGYSRLVDLNLHLLQEGLNGVMARVKAEQRKMSESCQLPSVSIAGYHKQVLLRSMLMGCEALIQFAQRHAELARSLASQELDPLRKKELEAIAERCDWVPANPPRNFAEALQSMFFLYLGLRKEPVELICLGRMDYYLYPYYEKDLREGKITRQEAAELLGCFIVKINNMEVSPLIFKGSDVPTPGSLLPHITIGGRTKEGLDTTNELSYLIVEVVRQLHYPEPAVYIRYHGDMSQDFLIKALKANRDLGGGNPAFLNDQLGTGRLLARGCKIEDAVDWSATGCLGYQLPHCNASPQVMGHLNLPKILEITLYNGFDPLTGKRLGLQTGEVTSFTSIDQFYAAFEKQFDRFVDIALKEHFIRYSNQMLDVGNGPLSPIMVEDCITKGLGPREGGERYPGLMEWFAERGCTDVADSLIAIKQLVFDEKKITIAELLKALRNNWEGYEDLHQACLKAPKYGNDEDYADDIFNYVSLKVQKIILDKRDPFTGGRLGLCRPAASGHVLHGEVVGALPNGRIAGESLNDAALSPMPGADINGPTAVINSATKVNHAWEEIGGITLNMKFSRPLLEIEQNLEKVLALVKTFFDRGGWHIQFNIVNADDLIDARKNPDKWRNLVVRVAGYSAFFVDLPYNLQDEIIARTMHKVI